MIDKEITVKDLKIGYKVFGSGKPVLILHGWGSNSERWQKVSELLAEKNFQIVVPDLPGFGKSEMPKVAWSLDNYVEWLVDFSQTVTELNDNFYLVGHSFGGALAVKFAIRHNQKVKKLFLVSAACVRTNTLIKKIFYRISKIIKVFSFMPFYPQFRKVIYRFIIKKSDYLKQEGIMKETYLKVILDDLSYKLIFIKVPTTIIWGDKDTLTPLEQAHFINKKIPHSKLIIIAGADHSLNIKVPETLSEKVLESF